MECLLLASSTAYPQKWSVTEKFHDYLYCADFTIVTDNNPLTYILTSAKLDAASHRWLATLSTFSFKLQYRAGRHNMDADSLSGRPHETSFHVPLDQELLNQFREQHTPGPGVPILTPDMVNAICQSCLFRSEPPSTLSGYQLFLLYIILNFGESRGLTQTSKKSSTRWRRVKKFLPLPGRSYLKSSSY